MARKNDNLQKVAMREMMRNWTKNSVISSMTTGIRIPTIVETDIPVKLYISAMAICISQSLTTTTATEIMELLASLHQEGNTIIMITHNERLIPYASRVIRIKDGKIVV